MNCLVTGGAGFIGSHLVDRLLKEGDYVTVLDDFSEGKMENLPTNHPHLFICKASINDGIEWLFSGIDKVYHLAALPRPQRSIAEPLPTHIVNVDGTLNVLLACRAMNVKRVVFTSSASIYGDQERYPSYENCEPNPMSPYALHKLIGEQYCKLFGMLYGMEINSLRLFNVYGTRMNPVGEYASVIPKFIDALKNNESPSIFGDGNQSRDFIHVEDVVSAFISAGESKVYGEVFNIGSEDNISVNQIFTLISNRMNTKIKPVHTPPVIEPRVTLASRDKARRLLDWKPKVTIYAGLDELCQS